MQNNFCRRCGKELSEKVKFCNKCGLPISKQIPEENSTSQKCSYEKIQKNTIKLNASSKLNIEKTYKRSTPMIALAIVLSFFIFIISLSLLSVLNIRIATSKSQGKANFEAILKSWDLTEIPISLISQDSIYSDMYIADFIYEKMSEYGSYSKLTPKKIQKYWEESNITEWLAEKTSSFFYDIYTGSATFRIRASDIKSLMMNDLNLINDIFGDKLTKDDVTAIAEDMVEVLELDQFTIKEFKEKFPDIYYVLQITTSYWVIAVLAVMLLIFILLLLKTNGNLMRTICDIGITFIIASAIWLVGGLMALPPNLWNYILHKFVPIGSVIGEFLVSALPVSVTIFLIGLVFIIVYIIKKYNLKNLTKSRF